MQDSFYILSKLFWTFASPLNLVVLLIFCGLFLRPLYKKISNFFIIVSLSLVVLFGLLPTGHNLMVYLEGQYERPELPDKISGILVLGGAFNISVSGAHGTPSFNDHGDRVTEALALSFQYPDAFLVFSGGDEGVYKDKKIRESDDTRNFIKSLQITHKKIFFEEGSRNSFENISYTKRLINPGQNEIWVLITSAFHMRRSMAVAEKLSWKLIPYPVDYKVTDDYRFYPIKFDVLGNFYKSHLAIKELIGYQIYKLTKKI